MKMQNLITHDPKILGGKPIISGTRMSVEVILEFLAGGMEIKEMLKEYPFLTKKHIQAAIQYAAKRVGVTSKPSKKSGDVNSPTAVLHEIHRRR